MYKNVLYRHLKDAIMHFNKQFWKSVALCLILMMRQWSQCQCTPSTDALCLFLSYFKIERPLNSDAKCYVNRLCVGVCLCILTFFCMCVCLLLELDHAQRLEERERILREIWMNGQPDISTVTQSLNRYYWHRNKQMYRQTQYMKIHRQMKGE